MWTEKFDFALILKHTHTNTQYLIICTTRVMYLLRELNSLWNATCRNDSKLCLLDDIVTGIKCIVTYFCELHKGKGIYCFGSYI